MAAGAALLILAIGIAVGIGIQYSHSEPRYEELLSQRQSPALEEGEAALTSAEAAVAEREAAVTKTEEAGSDAEIVDNHIGSGPMRLTLRAGGVFETSRCGTWTPVT